MNYRHSPWTSAAISLASWLAALSLSPLITAGGYPTGVAYLSIIVGVIGVVGGLLRLPRPGILLGQAAALVASLVVQGLNSADQLGLAMAGQPPERLQAVVATAIESIQAQNAPIASNPAVDWLILVAVGLIITICELLANGLEQPAWTIIPLLAPYILPALLLAADGSPLHAAFIGLGYLLVLVGLAAVIRSRQAAATSTRRAFALAGIVLLAQVALGIATVLQAAPLHMTIAHQGGALLLWVLILHARFRAGYPEQQKIRG